MKNFYLISIFVVGCVFNFLTYATNPTGYGWRVAVVDSGIMEDHKSIMSPRNRIDDQACFSTKKDIKQTPFMGHTDYKVAVTCKHDKPSDFLSKDAAIVPRKLSHTFLPSSEFEFGTSHGSNVSKVIIETANLADIIAINTQHFDSERMIEDEKGNIFECDVHADKNSQCYSPELPVTVLNWVRNKSKVAALNYSASEPRLCRDFNSQLGSFFDNEIAVVSSAGNRGANKSIVWPACNPYVISVGALEGGSIAPYTSLQGRIDFFADGDANDYKSGKKIQGTSFASPRVAAAFTLMKQLKPQATIKEMKYALEASAPKIMKYNWRNIEFSAPVVTYNSMRTAAKCLRDGTCLPPKAAPGTIGYIDGSSYGPAYGDTVSSNYVFQIDFSRIISSSSISPQSSHQNLNVALFNNTYSDVRDVELTFKGRHRGTAVNSNNQWLIKLNGTTVIESEPFFDGEHDFRFVINRNLFNPTTNTITIEPKYPNRDWGFKEIKAEFIEPIQLTVGRLDTNSYGYDSNRDRYTGLRATFEIASVTTDYALDVVGRDIDVADETAVFLNEKFLGHLSRSGNNRDNAGNRFVLKQADLSRGINTIEFVQRRPNSSWNGYQDERWLVKRLRVSPLPPNVKVTGFEVLDSSQKPNVPFSVKATIRNLGGSTTRSLDLNVYISNDAMITTRDSKVGTQRLNGFAASATLAKSLTIQSSLVNKDRYIGACIMNAPRLSSGGGASIATHCSKGVRLNDSVNITGAIMLLLDN